MSQNQASTGKKETPPVSSKEEEKAIDNEDTQQIPEKSQSISQEKDQQAEEQSQEMSKEQSKEQPKEQFKEKLYEQPKEKPEEQSKEKLQEQPKEPELQTKEKEESAQDKEVQEAQKLKQENIKPEPQKLDTKQEAKQADTQLNYQQANDKTQINQAVQKENKHVENAQSKVEEQPTSSQKNQSSLEIGSQLIKEKSPQQPIQTMQREGGSSQDYLQPVFKKINQNRDYSLDSQQIVLLSKQLGTNITNEDIKKFIKQTDENKNNKIEFNEFTKWWKMNSQKNDKLTAFVNLQDKALGGFKQISQKLSSKENSNDISKEADKLNLSIQYGDGTANNSIKFEFSFAGVKVEEHIKQNNDLNLNKFHRKIHFLIEIESTDVQKCQKQFQTALKRIKESTQDHNEILKIMDIEVVTNKTSVLAEFTSTHLDTSFKDLLQHMRKTQTDHGKHIFINLESEFTFKGQLNGKEESIFVQWLCEGFIAKLKVQGNTQVLQIIRKLVEGKVPHSLFSLLTLFKSSNVNLKLKSHQNVKGFFKKLGILELSQQTPLMKDMLFDLGSMLKEGQEAQDGKFRFLFKLCKEACSLGSHKVNLSLLFDNTLLRLELKSDSLKTLASILFQDTS